MEKLYESVNTGRCLPNGVKPKTVAEKKDNVVTIKKATDVKNELSLQKGAEESVNEEVHVEIKFPEKNPLENPLIINHVFELLNLEEIKQCRLVCTKWNDVSKSFVEKMCQITIGPPAKVNSAENRSLEIFNELIESSEITFRNFKLTSSEIPSARWSVQTLVTFFEDQRENLSKLTIENICVKIVPARNPDKYFSMDPYIGNNLIQLTIDNSKFTVSSDKLMTVKSLSFRNCMVRFVDNCRLRPEKIEMKYIQAMKNGKLIKVFNVNNHFKLDDLRELILQCRQEFKKVSINLKACDGILENLVLENVIVKNLPECKWEIKGKVKLQGIPFERKSLMQFTELHFGKADLNLKALPDSIEKLTLEMGWTERDRRVRIRTSSPQFSLPSLKYLQVFGDILNPYSPEILSLFADYQNLKTVKLAEDWPWGRQTALILRTEWISRSVESLSLDGKIKAVGNQIHLKRLVIQNYDLNSLKETLRLLKSDHLVIRLDSVHRDLETAKISLTLIGSPYETLAIGPFDFYFEVTDKGYFFNCVDVDKQSRYYNFANQKREGNY